MSRPHKITPELTKAICANLELAMPLKYAAENEGISESTVRSWIERGKAGEQLFADFAFEVMRSRGRAVSALTHVALGGGAGSRAAMWILERRYRDDYGPHQKLELAGHEGGALQIAIDPIDDPSARRVLEAALGRRSRGNDA